MHAFYTSIVLVCIFTLVCIFYTRMCFLHLYITTLTITAHPIATPTITTPTCLHVGTLLEYQKIN